MIKVNLAGAMRKKAAVKQARPRMTVSAPSNLLPIVFVLMAAATAVAGYLWYSRLSSRIEELTSQISEAQAEKAKLDVVIQQNRIYETRKQQLESRIKVIEDLKRNQITPVVSLDMLSRAVDRTRYVWLSNVDQNNTQFTMAGASSSLNALADFVSNLENTGYFHNVNLVSAQDTDGNYVFNMTCEFAPPQRAGDARGGN